MSERGEGPVNGSEHTRASGRFALVTPPDVQRQFLEQAHRATRQSIDVQRRFGQAFVHSLDAQAAARREARTVADTALELPIVAARAAVPDGDSFEEFEAAYRESVSSLDDATEKGWTQVHRNVADGVETYDEFAGMYADLVDATFAAAIAATDEFAASSRRAVEQSEPVEIDVEEVDDS